MKNIEITKNGIIVYQDNNGVLLSQNGNSSFDKHFKSVLEALKYYNVISFEQIFML